MRLSLLLAILPVALAAPATNKRAEPAPLITPRGAEIIPEKYIVKFKPGSDLSALDEALEKLTGDADHVYHDIFKGFASTLDPSMLETLRDHPDVRFYLMQRRRDISRLTTVVKIG